MADQPASASPKPKAAKPYNANDPNQVAQAKSAAQLLEKQRLNGLRATARQRDGRIWLRQQLECLHQSSFTGNSTTFFKEGERNQALRIMADLSTHCVPELLVIIAEGTDDAHGALRRALAILENKPEAPHVEPAATA